jgi:hypothetical protein
MWCGPCYTPHPQDKFYQFQPADESGFEWRPRSEQHRHRCARSGDHLLVPFQCDLCSFRNLCLRNPAEDRPQDQFLLCCIRRANLDAMWGRESLTVSATLRGARQLVSRWRLAHIPVELPPRGPFPVSDLFGMRVAIGMLIKSLEPGRYSAVYQQFETIRKLRATHSNLYMSSLEGTHAMRSIGGEMAKMSFAMMPTNSLWFERFAQGCLKRMGQDVRQDWALPLDVLHSLLSLLDEEWALATQWEDRHKIASAGAFAVIAFCGSFRGNEVFLTDLYGLAKYSRELAQADHVVVPLLGKYKGEAHNRYHLTPLAVVTDSGLAVRSWVNRLVQVQEEAGRSHGPAFGDRQGNMLEATFIEALLADRLKRVQDMRPDLIPSEVDCYEHFGISRSFRRGATSTARARGVDKDIVDLTNRWRQFEHAKGKHPRLSMQDHYSDIRIVVPELIKFSQAL